MADIKVKLLRTNIVKVNIDISNKEDKIVQIKAEVEAKIREPKDKSDNTAMLSAVLLLTEPERERVKIQLDADLIFEFDPIPTDYKDIIKEKCMPMAQAKLFEALDRILSVMGYPPMMQRKNEQENGI